MASNKLYTAHPVDFKQTTNKQICILNSTCQQIDFEYFAPKSLHFNFKMNHLKYIYIEKGGIAQVLAHMYPI